jgi:hypothetical protein
VRLTRQSAHSNGRLHQNLSQQEAMVVGEPAAERFRHFEHSRILWTRFTAATQSRSSDGARRDAIQEVFPARIE